MLFCPSFTQSERFLHTDQLITKHDKLHSRVDGKRDRERVQVRCRDLVGSDLPHGQPSQDAAFFSPRSWWMTRSSQAEGRSHYVAQQLQQAIYFFSKHVEEVAGLVVDSKKGGTKCMRTLSAQAQGSWALTCHFGGKRTGSKLMAKRAKHCRVEMTFLKRLRHAAAGWRGR